MKTWHKVAISIIVIVGILISLKSCIDKVDSDVVVAYVGHSFVSGDTFEKNAAQLEAVCDDVSGDGVSNVTLMDITITDETDGQYAKQKMTNAFGLGAARVYVLTEDYVILNSAYDVFEDLSHFGDGFKNAQGQIVAISLEGNEKIESLGFPQDERLYLAVRKVSEMDVATDKDIEKRHNSAMKIAEYILN